MKFRRRQSRDNFRVNLAPLIDTIFLLLIFFMMTTTFNRESQLKISLPEAKAEHPTEQQVIRIIINEDGEYAINDLDHSLINAQLETLTRALKKTAGEKENPPLLISADENAPHYAVIKALEAARDLGFTRLRFGAEQRPEQK